MSKIFLRYDVDKIRSDIPIEQVMETYAGIRVNNKKGNIHCPSADHNDKNPSAKLYKDTNSCHCFSCNKNFNVISLTEEYFPYLSFPEICRKLIDDFGLSVYNYSNLKEVEEARDASLMNKFYDCFPLTEDELHCIGLYNSRMLEQTYTVDAYVYYRDFYGEIPPKVALYDENGNRIPSSVPLTDESDRITYTEDGRRAFVEVDEKTAMSYGLYREELENVRFPSIQELWKANKYSIEEMLLGKAWDKCDELEIAQSESRAVLKRIKSDPALMKKVEEIQQAISDGSYSLGDSENEHIYNTLRLNEERLKTAEAEFKAVKAIYDKIKEHQAERKKAREEWKRK